jgi:voltage-gated potassium channel
MRKHRAAGPPGSLRSKTYDIVFGHEQGWGRHFDAVLMVFILGSVAAVMVDSVSSLSTRYHTELLVIEWTFTILFSLEYAVRIWCVRPVRAYTLSFFGIIDLLAVLPTYLSLFLPGGQYLAVVRILRVVRVFRVFKLVRFLGEASVLASALRNSRYKIAVFLVTVVCTVVVVGSLMFLIEGPESGITSIPRGVYWAIVTLSTVGYGDIAPQTPLGQALAAFVMILGYGIIAVPTGIVTAELANMPGGTYSASVCKRCEHVETDPDAKYCRFCSSPLVPATVAVPEDI